MPDPEGAGSSSSSSSSLTSSCPITHLVRVRITTLDPENSPEARSWATQVSRDFAFANWVYNRYGIQIQRGNREDLGIARSREILTLEDQGAMPPNPSESDIRLYSGDFQLNMRDSTGYAVTPEVRELLSENRGSASQVHAYWVPSLGVYGNTYHKDAYPAVGTREGVIMARNCPVDVFAHELGHLFTREGHYGDATNLMFGETSERRQPRELDDSQQAKILASQYVNPR